MKPTPPAPPQRKILDGDEFDLNVLDILDPVDPGWRNSLTQSNTEQMIVLRGISAGPYGAVKISILGQIASASAVRTYLSMLELSLQHSECPNSKSVTNAAFPNPVPFR